MVTFDTRDPQFESSHRKNIDWTLFSVNCIEKDNFSSEVFHRRRKEHRVAGLQINWIGFDQNQKMCCYLNVLKLLNLNQANIRPTVTLPPWPDVFSGLFLKWLTKFAFVLWFELIQTLLRDSFLFCCSLHNVKLMESITVRLTSCLTALDLAEQVNLLSVKQLNLNQTNRRSAVQWCFPLRSKLVFSALNILRYVSRIVRSRLLQFCLSKFSFFFPPF